MREPAGGERRRRGRAGAASASSSVRTRAGRAWVGEQHRPERDVGGSGCDQLERVRPRLNPSHAHDRQSRRPVGGVDRGERDRPKRRAGESTGAGSEAGRSVAGSSARPRIVLTSERPSAPAAAAAVGHRRQVGEAGRELGEERLAGRRASGGHDLRRLVLGRGDVRTREVQLERRRDLSRRRAARRGRRSPAAAKPPTDTQTGGPSSSSRGRTSARKRSIPGLARPIEFSIPTSVSAIRTGAFPSRGSGVTVFVTKPSSVRATSGAVERVEAAGGVEDHAAATLPAMAGVRAGTRPPRTGPSTQSRARRPSISTAHP